MNLILFLEKLVLLLSFKVLLHLSSSLFVLFFHPLLFLSLTFFQLLYNLWCSIGDLAWGLSILSLFLIKYVLLPTEDVWALFKERLLFFLFFQLLLRPQKVLWVVQVYLVLKWLFWSSYFHLQVISLFKICLCFYRVIHRELDHCGPDAWLNGYRWRVLNWLWPARRVLLLIGVHWLFRCALVYRRRVWRARDRCWFLRILLLVWAIKLLYRCYDYIFIWKVYIVFNWC